MLRLIICFFICFFPGVVLAATGSGIGDFATTLMLPTHILLNFVKTASMMIGLMCLFGAFILYMQRRINPMTGPWSTIILVFIIGIVLLCLPYVDKVFKNLP